MLCSSSIVVSIAEALNYQFGFEVSKTWFYKLLSRAFVPLVVVGALVILGMTCLLIVPDGEQAVLLHLDSAVRAVLPQRDQIVVDEQAVKGGNGNLDLLAVNDYAIIPHFNFCIQDPMS